MHTMLRFSPFLAILLGVSAFAEGPEVSNWSITAKGGLAFPVLGDFSGSGGEAATTTTDEDGNEVVTGNNANVLALDWGDAYDTFMTLAVEVDFWESNTRSLYLGVSHTRASGKTTSLGSFNDSNIQATFSDYSDIGLYAGFRWGLGETDWIKSLISAQLGAKFIDDIEAKIPNNRGIGTIPFYKRTTVFMGGAYLSLILTPLDFLEIGIDSGFEYQTAPEGDDSQLSLIGLDSINSEGSLGLVPVRILATIKF